MPSTILSRTTSLPPWEGSGVPVRHPRIFLLVLCQEVLCPARDGFGRHSNRKGRVYGRHRRTPGSYSGGSRGVLGLDRTTARGSQGSLVPGEERGAWSGVRQGRRTFGKEREKVFYKTTVKGSREGRGGRSGVFSTLGHTGRVTHRRTVEGIRPVSQPRQRGTRHLRSFLTQNE